MNDELRRAKNVNNMLRRKYDKSKTRESWKSFLRHRNCVTKLRKKSVRNYLAKIVMVIGKNLENCKAFI